MQEQRKQRLAILGSTGSIGVQTLEVVRAYPDLFEVEMLAAHVNWETLARQAVEFEPDCVVIADDRYYEKLSAALAHLPIKVYAGAEAAVYSVGSAGVDTVVSAMVGFAGLAPTLAAIRAGKKIALANKETLVVAGELIMSEARQFNAPILPVDSEHSAIFQCLVGEASAPKRVILTASGGAFRDVPTAELCHMTATDALKHPCWEMGAKITIDCATMMNKGFEVIEAKWLFDLKPEQINVMIHPQSIVHSLVECADGALKAQMGVPDMRLPIQYALTFPYRLPIQGSPSCDLLSVAGGLTFASPDLDKYPCLKLAYDVLGGAYGRGGACVMNAANEIAVAEFLAGRIRFTDIYTTILKALEVMPQVTPKTLDDYVALDAQTRECVREELMNTLNC